jgi:hypothetical protein
MFSQNTDENEKLVADGNLQEGNYYIVINVF